MDRRRTVLLLIATAALLGLYVPSSVGGVISRPLLQASIAVTFLLLVAIALASGRTAPPLNVAVSASILGLLAVFSLTSPFDGYSPGVVVLYGTLVVLFVLDLRRLQSRWVERLFGLISLVSLVAGGALALDVAMADRLLVAWYSAFYPELVGNMVAGDKPVLTFATHSTAGFMLYLFFYMHWRAWRLGAGAWHAVSATGFMGLMKALTSTTGLAFLAVALGQMAFAVFARIPARYRLPVLAGAAGVVAMAFGASQVDVDALLQDAASAVVGDKIRGLASRYATDGLLAGNFAYMMQSPFSPIGFGASETLYLGDSGVVVNLLRGSVPLALAVYFAYWLFLRINLVDVRDALAVWLATVAFEVGFTPMMYYRFVAFVPLLIVYLNTRQAGATARSGQAPRVLPG